MTKGAAFSQIIIVRWRKEILFVWMILLGRLRGAFNIGASEVVEGGLAGFAKIDRSWEAWFNLPDHS